jgi:hypothetical protein
MWKHSRQRAYQLRNIAAGKCSKCPRKLFTREYCKEHRDIMNRLQNARHKRRRKALLTARQKGA